jgi:hypothetical protein
MKRIIGALLGSLIFTLALAGTVVYVSKPAHASEARLQSPRLAYAVEAGLNVAAGAQIQSTVLVMDYADTCLVVAENSLGGSSRTLNVDWIASDGTTVLYRQAVTVTNATRQLVSIGPKTSTASLPSGVTGIPTMVGKRMQFTLTAAGAAVGSLAIYCQ